MSFRDNLQYLRASHSMTQEQLAMLLGVSRQSVTKWEAEKSYPEMDKLLKMCQIFDCSLDDLVQGDVTSIPASPAAAAKAAALRAAAHGPAQDVCGYDAHMRAFAWKVSWGVAVLLLGIAALIFVGGWAEAFNPQLEAFGLLPLFAGITGSVGLFVVADLQHAEFQRNHPYIQDFYTAAERQRTQHQFAFLLIVGILLVFAGIVAMVVSDGSGTFLETEMAGVMMVCMAAGAWCIVYGGMLLARLNVGTYNEAREQAIAENDAWNPMVSLDAATLREVYTDDQIRDLLGVENATDAEIDRARARLARKRRKSQLTSGLCGIIMLVATIAGLALLLVPAWFTPFFWLAWVFGGLLCAVASIFVATFVKDEPTQ